MVKFKGTVPQRDFRNLNQQEVELHLKKVRAQAEKLYGPGIFTTVIQPNGDIEYIHEYDPDQMPYVSRLSEDEVKAIAHGRTVLANLGNVFLRDGQWVSRVDPESDPAIPERLASLNTLEALLTKYGRPS